MTILDITSFYRIGICGLQRNDSGDFLEVLTESSNPDMFYLGICDNDDAVICYHNDLGFKVYRHVSVSSAIDSMLNEDLPNSLPKPILLPLLLASYTNNLNELSDVFENGDFEFISADQTDDVEQFKSDSSETYTIFGIVDATYNIEATYNENDSTIVHDDEDLYMLSELSGRFNEDETWVVILKPSRS